MNPPSYCTHSEWGTLYDIWNAVMQTKSDWNNAKSNEVKTVMIDHRCINIIIEKILSTMTSDCPLEAQLIANLSKSGAICEDLGKIFTQPSYQPHLKSLADEYIRVIIRPSVCSSQGFIYRGGINFI